MYKPGGSPKTMLASRFLCVGMAACHGGVDTLAGFCASLAPRVQAQKNRACTSRQKILNHSRPTGLLRRFCGIPGGSCTTAKLQLYTSRQSRRANLARAGVLWEITQNPGGSCTGASDTRAVRKSSRLGLLIVVCAPIIVCDASLALGGFDCYFAQVNIGIPFVREGRKPTGATTQGLMGL